MSSRSILDLDPRIQESAFEVKKAWEAAGLDVLITCTFRSNEEQDRLYAQGRTTPGKIVTHAKAGQSLHNRALAIDFVPMVNGKPDWEDNALFEKAARIAISCDERISWGGDWSSAKRDAPHLEWNLAVA